MNEITKLEEILNGFREKRYFRSVVFSSPDIATLPQAAALLGDVFQLKKIKWDKSDAFPEGVDGVRMQYTTKQFHLKSTDPTVRKAFRVTNRSGFFRYEIDILRYRDVGETIFLVAVPFSALASEIISKIEENRPSSSFHYIRPSLQLLYQYLVASGAEAGLSTTAINWYVSGDGNFLNQIILRGSNLGASKTYLEILNQENAQKRKNGSSSLHGIKFSVRRIQLVHQAEGVEMAGNRLKVTFDRSGQAAIWVTDDARNLRDMFSLIKLLKSANVLLRVNTVPVTSTEEEGLMG